MIIIKGGVSHPVRGMSMELRQILEPLLAHRFGEAAHRSRVHSKSTRTLIELRKCQSSDYVEVAGADTKPVASRLDSRGPIRREELVCRIQCAARDHKDFIGNLSLT